MKTPPKNNLQNNDISTRNQFTLAHNTEYRPEIDSLRAIAVIAVLLSHWIPGFAYPLNWGLCGVYLFFLISGYVITRGLIAEKTSSNGRINLQKFFKKRILRIWPIYFLTIFFIHFFWPGFYEGGIGWHMTFLSNAFFSIEGKFLFPVHFWSLSVEQQFYLFWPILVLFTSQRQLQWTCIAMLTISPWSRWYFAEMQNNIPASYYSLSSNLDCLAAGSLLAIGERSRISKFDFILNCAGVAGILLLIYIIMMKLSGSNVWDTTFTASAILGISAWVIGKLGSKQKIGAWLCNPLTIYIGKVSYGIYLYHLLVGSYLYNIFGKHFIWTYAITSFLLTFALASLSWHFIERPIIQKSRD